MPQKVEKEITAGQLHAKDVITRVPCDTLRYLEGSRVVSVDKKVKFAHLVLVRHHNGAAIPGPSPRKVPLDAKLTVLRQELTREDEIEAARKYIINWIDSNLQADMQLLEESSTRMQDLAAGLRHDWSHQLEYHFLLRARVEEWRQVVKLVTNGDASDLIEAVRMRLAKTTGNLLGDRPDHHSALSKIYSAILDTEAAGQMQWVRDVRFRLDAMDPALSKES